MAVPLAMAFAIASGLPPQAGLYTAIVAGFLVSGLGGSRFQIGGPTGAFIVVVAGIVDHHGVNGLFMCTLMAGVLLVLLSAILLVVAWNMGDWEEIPELLRLSKSDISVWLVTLGLTVLADLTIAYFRIQGPFMVGAAEKLAPIADRVDRLALSRRRLILAGARAQPAQLMDNAEFDEHVGHENIRPSIEDALAWAATVTGPADGGPRVDRSGPLR